MCISGGFNLTQTADGATPSQKGLLVAQIGPAGFFGTTALLKSRVRVKSTATAAVHSEVYSLTREQFARLQRKSSIRPGLHVQARCVRDALEIRPRYHQADAPPRLGEYRRIESAQVMLALERVPAFALLSEATRKNIADAMAEVRSPRSPCRRYSAEAMFFPVMFLGDASRRFSQVRAEETDDDVMADHGNNWLMVVAEGTLRFKRRQNGGKLASPAAYDSAAVAAYALATDEVEMSAGDVVAVGRAGEEGEPRSVAQFGSFSCSLARRLSRCVGAGVLAALYRARGAPSGRLSISEASSSTGERSSVGSRPAVSAAAENRRHSANKAPSADEGSTHDDVSLSLLQARAVYANSTDHSRSVCVWMKCATRTVRPQGCASAWRVGGGADGGVAFVIPLREVITSRIQI